jgi:DNA polymerase (family 10)
MTHLPDTMPVHNADISLIFEEIADRLEIQGANPFRIRAYRNAARTLGELPQEARALLEKGEDLTHLPGIGDDLAGKIREIVTTGHCSLLERLRRELPPAVTELLQIPGLGPKRVKALYHDLEVQTVEQLYRAARDGRIRTLPGFGEKTELNIQQAVEAHVSQARRFKLAVAAQYAESLTAYLKAVPGVKQVTAAGSFRRMRETVGDLDILVTARAKSPVMQRFTAYDDVADVLSAGSTRASVVLKSGLQVDLRVVEEKCYGAALCYFTGSKAHNIAIRRIAQKLGLKVNEYGVFKGDTRIAGEDEASVYQSVGLPFIPPELREDRGEIEAAHAGRLPHLVELADLRGDLHVHTKATDGHDSLRDMALAAKELGLEYLAITEHSRRLTVAHGLDPLRLARQCEEIDRLNTELEGIMLLKGIEVDIL